MVRWYEDPKYFFFQLLASPPLRNFNVCPAAGLYRELRDTTLTTIYYFIYYYFIMARYLHNFVVVTPDPSGASQIFPDFPA